MPKLNDLIYELKWVDWYELGVELDLPEHVLNSIKRENRTEARRIAEVLRYWLNNGEACWKDIVEVLKRIGGHENIIKTIELEYITQSGETT